MSNNIQPGDELMQAIWQILPEAAWEYDNDGQIIIYTGKFCEQDEDKSTKEVQA